MAFILLLFLLTSCTTQNDWEQYPPVQDSVPVYEDDDINLYHYYPGYHPRTPGMKVQPDYSSGVIQRKVPSMVPNERTMPATRTTTTPKTVNPAPKVTPSPAPKTSPAPRSTYSRPTPRPAPRSSYRPSPSPSRRRF